MKNRFAVPLLAVVSTFCLMTSSCTDIRASNKETNEKTEGVIVAPKKEKNVAPTTSVIALRDISLPPANEILAKKQVPILCYHQVRDYRETDSKSARDYIVPPTAFR